MLWVLAPVAVERCTRYCLCLVCRESLPCRRHTSPVPRTRPRYSVLARLARRCSACAPVAVAGHRVLRNKLLRVLEWKERVVGHSHAFSHRNRRLLWYLLSRDSFLRFSKNRILNLSPSPSPTIMKCVDFARRSNLIILFPFSDRFVGL